MNPVQRGTRLLLSLAAAALLAACSSEDARQVAAAAAALRSASETAVGNFAQLQARARKAPASWSPMQDTTRIVADQLRQAQANPTAYSSVPANLHAAEMRKFLTPTPAAFDQRSMQILDPVLARARLMEAAAASYAKAWPLGTEHLVCMRSHLVAYGKGMRDAALLLNAPTDTAGPGVLYQRFDNELAELSIPLQQAASRNDPLRAAEAVERLKARLQEERRENARVQLAFARSAEAAAVAVDAIDRAGSINLADVLGTAQALLPRLSGLASPGEIDSAMTSLGAVAGQINGDAWLTQLANMPIGTVACANP